MTQVVVDPADPAFAKPTKPIGSFMSKEEADKIAAEKDNCYGQANYAYYNYAIKMYHNAVLWMEKAIANGYKDENNNLAILRKAANLK